LLAVQCRELCMAKMAKGADEENQKQMHYKSFHGSESHTSVVDLLLKANGPYLAAFDKVPIENNRAGNEARATDGYMFELREYLHCDPNARYAVHDLGFTREAICLQKGEEPVSGRILYDKALKVIANYKHALKHYNSWADEKHNDPSGQKLEDMLDYIRRKMFLEFKGCKDKPTGKAYRNKAAVEEDDMPVRYVWNGYFAFVMFGPRPLSAHPMGCLSKDGKGAKKMSRKACRDEEAKEKEAERNAGTGGYIPDDYRRGVSLANKTQVAQLARSEHADHARNLRELLASASQDIRDVLDELRLCNEQHRDVSESNVAEQETFSAWRKDLIKDLKTIREKKRQYEKALNDHTAKRPRQIENLYMQVGTFSTSTEESTEGTTTPRRPVTEVHTRNSDDASRLTSNNDNDENDDEVEVVSVQV